MDGKLFSKSGEVNQVSGACNGEVCEESKWKVEGQSSNKEVGGVMTNRETGNKFDNRDINKVNRKACDGEVVVDSGESNGEVSDYGIGGATTNYVNNGEVKCGEQARKDCGNEF